MRNIYTQKGGRKKWQDEGENGADAVETEECLGSFSLGVKKNSGYMPIGRA